MEKKVADKEEMLRVLDENGNFTGEYVKRSVAHENKIYHNEVALWIINPKGEVLLQRRSPNKKIKPNKLGLVAGHVAGDETMEETLAKEASEEIGIDISRFGHTLLCRIKRDEEKNCCFSNHYYIVADIPLCKIKIQQEELSEVIYMDFYELKNRVKNGDDEFVFVWNKNYELIFGELEKVVETTKAKGASQFSDAFKKLVSLVEKQKLAVVSTSNKKGILSSSWVNILSFDSGEKLEIWFQTDDGFEKIQNIKENENVAICLSGGVSLKGKAKVMGKPKDNKIFYENYKIIHEKSFNSYTNLPNEICVKIVIFEAKIWNINNFKDEFITKIDLEKRETQTIKIDKFD